MINNDICTHTYVLPRKQLVTKMERNINGWLAGRRKASAVQLTLMFRENETAQPCLMNQRLKCCSNGDGKRNILALK